MFIPVEPLDSERDGPAILVCEPATGVPAVTVGERRCQHCPTVLWVSASMLGHVDAGNALPTCAPCTQRLLATAHNPVAILHPDQIAELRELGILDSARHAVGLFNARARSPYN